MYCLKGILGICISCEFCLFIFNNIVESYNELFLFSFRMVHSSVIALIPKLTQIVAGGVSIFLIGHLCFNEELKYDKKIRAKPETIKERSFVI